MLLNIVRTLPLALCGLVVTCQPAFCSITIEPLENPSFEDGVNGWDVSSPFTPDTMGINTVPAFAPSDGSKYLGGYRTPTTPAGALGSAGILVRASQRVDVSDFDSIDSVTFGLDVFAIGVVTSGAGTVEFGESATAGARLRYRAADGQVLDDTLGAYPARDIFTANDLRLTDTTIPDDTASIEIYLNGRYIASKDPPHEDPMTFDAKLGYDEVYLSITGSKPSTTSGRSIPEASSLATWSLLSTVIGLSVTHRGRGSTI